MTPYGVISCHKVRLLSGVEGKWTNWSYYDTTWCHKGVSLKGYHWISNHWESETWSCQIVSGPKKIDFWQIHQRSTINWGHLSHKSSEWSLGTSGLPRFSTRPGQWSHQKSFPISFCLTKTAPMSKNSVSQSIFDPQTRSKAYFRRSALIWAQFSEK